MSYTNFLESTPEDNEYKYKILVYPNITFAKDLNKDSYVVVIYNIIKNLNKIRTDLHWTLLLPHKLDMFKEFKNVDQELYNVPTYPNQMRTNFNSEDLLDIIDWKAKDFDFVYSHLPEHTLQLKNLFYNTTNLSPLFFGYSHWTEFPEVTNYPMTVMDVNFLGLKEMEFCGINTKAQAELVLKYAKKNFNASFVDKVKGILKPQYLGWEVPRYADVNPLAEEKVIVFNHRPNAYKGYDWFLKRMDELYKIRQDFKVWVPLAEVAERDYMIVGKSKNRVEYFSNLKNCTVGVCCKQTYKGWSVSATDGMSVGVPYLFFDEDYYHELAEDAGKYYENAEQFIMFIQPFLDDPTVRETYSKASVKRYEESTWEHRITEFNESINGLQKKLHKIDSSSDGLKRIVKIIKDEGSITKKKLLEKLNWGIQIKFSSYRNALRELPNIKMLKNRYEYINS